MKNRNGIRILKPTIPPPLAEADPLIVPPTNPKPFLVSTEKKEKVK